MKIDLLTLIASDIPEILDSFRSIGIYRSREVYDKYLSEQGTSRRTTYISKVNDRVAGHISINYYPTLTNLAYMDIPMICDLFVFPQYRCKGIGTLLMDKAEVEISQYSDKAALGVGICSEDAVALRMYLRRGFQPMTIGAVYHDKKITKGEQVIANDDLLIYLEKSLSKVDM